MEMEKLWLIASIAVCICMSRVDGFEGKLNQKTFKEMSGSGNISLNEAHNKCNSTFMIKLEYLQELNDTGSFPDELEKTPMCFIKCYLESLGVLGDESTINTQKTIEVYQLKNEEIAEECRAEITSATVTDECEKAYYFARCIMTRLLLSNLGDDHDNV